MPRFFRHTALGLFLLSACALAAADGAAGLLDEYRRVTTQGRAVNRLDIDNDSLLLNRDDGFYSSGFRFTREHALREGGQVSVFGWRLGQEFYTASDIKLRPPQIAANDHPYAGWLYGGFFRETRRQDGSQWRYGIDLGCLGPCAGARWTQTQLHKLLDQPLPQGWSTQVRDEFGVILHGALTPLRWKPAAWMDVAPVLHGRFGNIHTDAGAGVIVRAGQLPGFADAAGLHGYLRLDARAVAWNASLQGGYFSSNNARTVKPKRAVGEAELGLAWNSGPYGVTGAVVRRSTEIDALSNAQGAQTFVRLLLTYAP